MLNHEFLQRKIKLIHEDLAHLESLGMLSFQELMKDKKGYDAAERNLERIVTRAIDINRHCIAELGKGDESVRTYEDTFLRMGDLGILSEELSRAIAPSAGLRNILVHEYDAVEPKHVFESIGQALSQYAQYCDALLQYLARHAKTTQEKTT